MCFMSSIVQIFVKRENREYGPYTIEKMIGYLAKGNFAATDFASSDRKEWMQLSQFPELGAGFSLNLSPSTSNRDSSLVAPQRDRAISSTIVDKLGRTEKWVTLLSVISFIFCGLMMLNGVGMLFILSSISKAFGVVACLVFLLTGALYFYPALKLYQYGRASAKLRISKSEIDLEAALEAQRSFWAFVGKLTVVLIVIYFLVFVVLPFVLPIALLGYN